MRSPRVIIVDDDPIILEVFSLFLGNLGYEVLTFVEPERCPIYRTATRCESLRPCSDVMLIDYWMHKMSGVKLLEAQVKMGCRLTIQNKALISGYLDQHALDAVAQLGCKSFTKPPDMGAITEWLEQCKTRIDLTQPLGFPRKEERYPFSEGVPCMVKADHAVFPGKAVNRSHNGLCLKVGTLLRLKQIVTLMTELPDVSLTGMVRWVREAGDTEYLVGLSCS